MTGVVAASFETPAFGGLLQDEVWDLPKSLGPSKKSWTLKKVLDPQKVSNPYGEERGNAARLEPSGRQLALKGSRKFIKLGMGRGNLPVFSAAQPAAICPGPV
jgi:hypothetical protein